MNQVDLIALITVCLHEEWSWEGGLPLLPVARRSMVLVTVNASSTGMTRLQLGFVLGQPALFCGPTPAQHNCQWESPQLMFSWAWGINGRWNKCLGSWMALLKSLLDGVGFPSGTRSDCVSCFASKGRKYPTSGFSWTGWVIHFVLHCPFLRLQLRSLNRKLSQTDWTLGKPFYDPENALHIVFVSLPGAQTSWAPSPLPGRPPTAWHQQCFLACLGCLKSLGLNWETDRFQGNKGEIQFSFG